VLRVELNRPLPDGRLSNHLAVLELISRQIDFHAAWKPVPHVRFFALAVPEDVSRQDFSAKALKQAGAKGFDAYAIHPYYGSTAETPRSPPPPAKRGAPPTAVTLGNILAPQLKSAVARTPSCSKR